MHPFDRFFRFVLPPGSAAVLGTVIGVGWFTQPDRYATGYAPEQPIAFHTPFTPAHSRFPAVTAIRAQPVPELQACPASRLAWVVTKLQRLTAPRSKSLLPFSNRANRFFGSEFIAFPIMLISTIGHM